MYGHLSDLSTPYAFMSAARPQRLEFNNFSMKLLGIALAFLLASSNSPALAEEPATQDLALGIRYEAGRGLRVGETGLTIGGFISAEGESLEDGESRASIEGLNVFLFFNPLPFISFFSEIEVSSLASAEGDGRGLRSHPGLDVDRLHVDLATSDLLGLRVGKFFTPIGRWNLAPAEPLVWTTSEPLIVEEVFDEEVTGAMLSGTLFPKNASLAWSLYATFLDPIAPDREAPPAEHSAGTHLEWASLDGWSLGLSYFVSEPHDGGPWNHLAGADLLWNPFTRLELSSELVFGEGTRENGALWGLYAQAVFETIDTLYTVARVERFDPPGSGPAIDLFTLGLAWNPRHFLRLKADYRFADHAHDLAEPGFRSSLSLLF